MLSRLTWLWCWRAANPSGSMPSGSSRARTPPRPRGELCEQQTNRLVSALRGRKLGSRRAVETRTYVPRVCLLSSINLWSACRVGPLRCTRAGAGQRFRRYAPCRLVRNLPLLKCVILAAGCAARPGPFAEGVIGVVKMVRKTECKRK